MASLNTSANGPSITKSYQSVVNAPAPSGAAAASPTYGQWAVFSVTAPLVSSFQQDGGNKESVLKVQSSGEGELLDLIDEFSDGKIQFAYVKVKDSNSGLPKNALIGWCGEGVPERTKGYFTSHLTAVSKLLHGYHVQITARSDRDLTPEGIIQKVADASGAKYSAGGAPPPLATATKPTVGSKPAFTPTQSSGAAAPRIIRPAQNVDNDGWGADAPQVTRTQLEKVEPAYKPTKVNMRELTASKPAAEPAPSSTGTDRPDVVRGAYQPIGKVDIAAIRRQAQESGSLKDDRPELVKGAYQPIGKVDIAAIRARAQKPDEPSDTPTRPKLASPGVSEQGQSPSMGERSASYSKEPERLTSLPKPKVANKFGGGSGFMGTKAAAPGGFDAKPVAPAAATGLASRTFADQGGKTPAQIWAEKKARERGTSGSGDALPAAGPGSQAPIKSQASGDGAWKSGYTGKSWAPVQINRAQGESIGQQKTGDAPEPPQETDEPEEAQEEEESTPAAPSGGIGGLRDRFSGAAPMGAPRSTSFNRPAPSAPEPETSTKPNRGVPIPGMPAPPAQPRSPTPPTPEARDASPIRVAVPVSKTEVTDAHDEQEEPPQPVPTRSIAKAMPEPESDDEPETRPDPARGASQIMAETSTSAPAAARGPSSGGPRARAEYDYEAAEDNEVSLREGEIVTDIEQVDPDWWMIKNEHGQTGLVPSNYLVMMDGEEEDTNAEAAAPPSPPGESTSGGKGATATALYDYEAGEDNELSFPENATIENITFPDEDWWHGEYKGKSGLFPANYTKIND